MIFQRSMTITEKLEILSDAAKYDVQSSAAWQGDGTGIGEQHFCRNLPQLFR